MLLFLLVLLIYGTSPVVTNGDSFLVIPTAHSLLHDQNLDIDEHLGMGTDGGIAYLHGSDRKDPGSVWGVELPERLEPGMHAYDFFPWVTALLSVPLVALFELADTVGIHALDVDHMLASGDTGLLNLMGASVFTALAVLTLSAVAWHGLALSTTRRRRAAFLVGVVAALGTPAWSTLSRALWNQTISVLFLSLAMLLALRIGQSAASGAPQGSRSRFPLLLGATAAAAYTARPTNAVTVVALGLWLLLQHRDALRAYVAGGLAVGIPWVAVSLATYGQLVPPYHSTSRAGLRAGTLEAIVGNLVSPNRGLLIFTPIVLVSLAGLLLAVKRRGSIPRSLAITGAGIAGAHLIVVSGAGEAWWAGSSYGPRFMADLLPVGVLLALPAVEAAIRSGSAGMQRTILVLTVLSVLLHLPGAWSKPAQCWNLEPVSIDADPTRAWDWRDPQMLRPVRVFLDTRSPADALFGRCDDQLDRGAARSANRVPSQRL